MIAKTAIILRTTVMIQSQENVLSDNNINRFLVNWFVPSAVAKPCYTPKRKRQKDINHGNKWQKGQLKDCF